MLSAPPLDEHRDDAVRCCEETARQERGERLPLRLDPHDVANSEFSEAAAWIAAEVAMEVHNACRAARQRVDPAIVWDMAAKLLRNGWQRGHRLVAMAPGRGGSPC